jgi:hypothetical protein
VIQILNDKSIDEIKLFIWYCHQWKEIAFFEISLSALHQNPKIVTNKKTIKMSKDDHLVMINKII